MDTKTTGTGLPGLFPGGSYEVGRDQPGDSCCNAGTERASGLVGDTRLRVRRVPCVELGLNSIECPVCACERMIDAIYNETGGEAGGA